MRKLILLFMTAALTSWGGVAGCPVDTLDSYLALGPEGCSVGGVLFTSFNYADAAGGPSAADINVFPLAVDADYVELTFVSALWSVGQGNVLQFLDSQIGYNAGVLPGFGPFASAGLSWPGANVAGFNSYAQVGEQLLMKADLAIQLYGDPFGPAFVLDDSVFFGDVASALEVQNHIQLQAGSDSILDGADMFLFTNSYFVTSGGSGGGEAPEPSVSLMIGGGLLLVGLLRRFRKSGMASLAAVLLLPVLANAQTQPATMSVITGEIERLTLDAAGDVWSGGRIVVGGQSVIIPRNLLMDLPANRLSLQQLFAKAATEACLTAGQSGLAKGDTCLATGTAGFATIHANRTSAGNVIAGDVFIQKGLDVVTGVVTYINHSDGYFRLNGAVNDPNTGVMVRLNDPTARHSIQQGAGCLSGQPNCSPDPRFALDAENYVNVFATGYPWCLPSTISRNVVDTLDLDGDGNRSETLSVHGTSAGTGDLMCPDTNRTVNNGQPVNDSRFFAPLRMGDSLTAEGNFETIGGVRFLSAHTTTVAAALTTKNVPGQPDYLFLDEVGIDMPAFQNERVRTLIIGYSTLGPSDVLVWSIHRDPATNAPHEFPLASSRGCDLAAGVGVCTQQGLTGQGANIFRIRHDVDFVLAQTGPPATPRLSPCAHLRADPRFAASRPCPNGGSFSEEFAILSPVPHEIVARTGKKLAEGTALITLDIQGRPTTNGEYLFPLGIGLGGLTKIEFNEIDLARMATPFSFSGIPWNLDRRLSPGGCDGNCEATPQPLDPFPFEGFDPRTQARVPAGPYSDAVFTARPLANVANRVLSYADAATGKFNGDATVLAWPPVNPGLLPIFAATPVTLACVVPLPPPPPPPPPADTTAPTAPASLSSTVSGSTVTLTWAAATDAVGVTGYRINRDGALVTGVGQVLTYNDLNVAPGTYSYTVQAVDAAGNVSAASPATSATIAPPPAATLPVLALRASVTANPTVPISLTWSATGAAATYEFQQSLNGGAFVSVPLVPPTSRTATLSVAPGTWQFRARALDAAGNAGPYAVTAPMPVSYLDDTAPGVVYGGNWQTGAAAGAFGGAVHSSSAAGATATLTAPAVSVNGRLAWVATMGPDRGRATISLNNQAPLTIDLYSATPRRALLVFRISPGAGTHTLRVTVAGTRNALSTGNLVDVDGFVVVQ